MHSSSCSFSVRTQKKEHLGGEMLGCDFCIRTRLFPVLEAVKQFRMAARQRYQPAADKHIFDIRRRLQNITVGDYYIRDLSDINRTHFVRDAEDIGGVERDGF